MEHGVSAIRGPRAGSRFVLPASQQRERRLGLHGVFRTSSGPVPGPIAQAGRQPLRAVRAATRAALRAGSQTGATGLAALRDPDRPRWAPARSDLHDPRLAGPSPWRE